MRRIAKTWLPGRTRTFNPSVNSRMLCQLSYRGPARPRERCRGSRDDSSVLAYPRQLAGSARLPSPVGGHPPRGIGAPAPGRMRQDGTNRADSRRDRFDRVCRRVGDWVRIGGEGRPSPLSADRRHLPRADRESRGQIDDRGGRRKIANRISPDSGFVTVTEIDEQTAIIERAERVERVVERQAK